MPERGSKTSTLSLVWANFGIFSAQFKWFPSVLVTMDEMWLYHYDVDIKQQWMEWRHSGSPNPKISEYWNSLHKFSPRFLTSRRHLLNCLSYKGLNNVRVKLLILCGFNLRIFWRKNWPGRSPRGFWFDTTMLRLTWQLQPRRNWPTWSSSIVIMYPILLIWPRRNITCSLDRKFKISQFFFRRVVHCRRRDLVGQTNFWICLSGLQTLQQRAKNCWVSWGVCWINPEFDRCSLFPSWSG